MAVEIIKKKDHAGMFSQVLTLLASTFPTSEPKNTQLERCDALN